LSQALLILGFIGCLAGAIWLEVVYPLDPIARGASRLLWLLIGAWIVGSTWRIGKIVRLLEQIRDRLSQNPKS
jgi:hypothetical protein